MYLLFFFFYFFYFNILFLLVFSSCLCCCCVVLFTMMLFVVRRFAVRVRQGNTDTREKHFKDTGKLIKKSMKLSTLLIISAIVAAFGSLQVEGFGTPYKPKPRTDIPRCDSPAHTRKPGSRCYLPRYDVHGDFNQFDEDDENKLYKNVRTLTFFIF